MRKWCITTVFLGSIQNCSQSAGHCTCIIQWPLANHMLKTEVCRSLVSHLCIPSGMPISTVNVYTSQHLHAQCCPYRFQHEDVHSCSVLPWLRWTAADLMLLEGTSLFEDAILVVISNEFLLEGSVMAHFSLIVQEWEQVSVPRLNYRLLPITRLGKDVVQGMEQRRGPWYYCYEYPWRIWDSRTSLWSDSFPEP